MHTCFPRSEGEKERREKKDFQNTLGGWVRGLYPPCFCFVCLLTLSLSLEEICILEYIYMLYYYIDYV